MGPFADWQWNVYSTLLIAMAAIALASTYYAKRRRKVPWIDAGIAMLIAGAVWSAAYALELASPSFQAKFLWVRVWFTALAAVPVPWLVLSSQYTGHAGWLSRRAVALAALPCAAFVALLWTNQAHYLVWREVSLQSVTLVSRTYRDLARLPAIGYWCFVAYFLTVILISSVQFARTLVRSRPLLRWQTVLMLIVLSSLVINGIVEVATEVYPNYLPLTYTASCLVLIWGMSYVRTGDLVAVSRRMILDNLIDPIIVLDAQGRIAHLNAAARRLIRSSTRHPVGQPIAAVWPAGAETFSTTPEAEVRQELTLDRESRRIFDVRISPVLDWSGRPVGRVAALRDITEIRQAERERQVLQAQILQSSKLEAMGTLAGGIAHDFNNLLTAIQGNATLAKGVLNPGDPAYLDVNEIELACRRATRLTRQLLMFSRKQPIESIPIDLNTTVHELLEMLERLIGEDIAISVNPAPDLWVVQADQGNLEQVIINLAINARDAMPQGGRITIETRNVILDKVDPQLPLDAYPGQFACLSVTDTGIGMDEEILRRIFEPFFSTKGSGQGTGLGLAVVDNMVKLHRGWIAVKSQVGQGSTFDIYLPADVGSSAEKMPAKSISLEGLQGQGERILLVEDAEDVREFAVRVLSQNGYFVMDAPDVQSALEILEREGWQFDLLFSDVVLPDRTGIELADQVLARGSTLRILLSSGYTGQRSRWDTIRDRGMRFLQKPYSLVELLRAIRETLA